MRTSPMTTTPKLSWVFDIISPFAYLGFKQLPALPQGVELEFVPILFAGLLNHHGQIGNAEIVPKRRFTYRFSLWRAQKMGIPMRYPPAHPFNPLAALRLILAAGNTRRAIERVFDAVFKQGTDVADPAVIAALATELGVENPATALAAPELKQKLRDNTNWAIERGVFGVPTLLIGDEAFWGHDAFDMALDYLRDPQGFESPEMQRVDSLPYGSVRRP
jgi:2-hydroxychromene-2-carboxylate isomerase